MHCAHTFRSHISSPLHKSHFTSTP
ncbi:Protein CBG25543 [Caenorhabditis briggsae]|uniref:Protein CBG25543 n=1 Tax=Caenorhabditis briggsae TaxID=6238 RepID=B6IIR5_CAEBR|nr:Protein CBG25543 [Caenorhabditis briggsae]CAR99795.1 Protein CBG25543 [Caenorhabditis briggsae]